MKKYSLWKVVHESIYTVTAYKTGDTDSERQIEIHCNKSMYNFASPYRKEKELNADHIQFFNND